MKRTILACLICTGSFVHAQSVKYFYDKLGNVVDEPKGVYYAFDPDTRPTTGVDTVITYYKDTDKSRELTVYTDGAKHGAYIRWYPNGTMREKTQYVNNVKTGVTRTWYESGKPHQTVEFKDLLDEYPLLIKYNDENGNLLVNNGNGVCRCFNDDFEFDPKLEIGKIVDGRRDSVWSIYDKDTLQATEVYVQGKFIKGTAIDGARRIPYTIKLQQSEFRGGIEAMQRFIARTTRYPSSARKAGYEDKVFVQFVITKEGAVKDVEVIRGKYLLLE